MGSLGGSQLVKVLLLLTAGAGGAGKDVLTAVTLGGLILSCPGCSGSCTSIYSHWQEKSGVISVAEISAFQMNPFVYIVKGSACFHAPSTCRQRYIVNVFNIFNISNFSVREPHRACGYVKLFNPGWWGNLLYVPSVTCGFLSKLITSAFHSVCMALKKPGRISQASVLVRNLKTELGSKTSHGNLRGQINLWCNLKE